MTAGSNTKTSPALSVVMPIHNTAVFLRESIEAVLAQTFRDFELILVNDGSTDDSRAVCEQYVKKDPRVRLINKAYGGTGSARNAGLAVARGEFITFPDSDDYLLPEAYAVCFAALEAEAPDLLVFGYKKVFMTKDAQATIKSLFIPEALHAQTEQECRSVYSKLVFNGIMNQAWNKLYRMSIIREHNLRYEHTRRAQDAFFSGEYVRHIRSMVTLPKALYCYRTFGKQNFWNKFSKDSYLIDIKYNSFIEELLREFGEYDGESRKLADRWFFNTVFRDAGYYRNPNWHFNHKEKIDYIENILCAEYNQTRAKTAWAKDKKAMLIRKRILNRDASGLMRDIRLFSLREKGYGFYSRTVRKILKRGG